MSSDATHITLAIESAIDGGSLAIFRNGELIDGLSGPAGLSRAEDMLPNIDLLLKRNGLAVAEIREIVAGAGPGSFTGIRIGLASAAGLAAATGAALRRVSSLAAMAMAAGGVSTCVVPVGRDTLCFQDFAVADGVLSTLSEPIPISSAAFSELVTASPNSSFVLGGSNISELSEENFPNLKRSDSDLAYQIGRFGHLLPDIEPMFIGKPK